MRRMGDGDAPPSTLHSTFNSATQKNPEISSWDYPSHKSPKWMLSLLIAQPWLRVGKLRL